MQIKETLDILREDGYCLWVGAGVARHLSGSENQERTPIWSELATQLEEEAKLSPLPIPTSFPQRFERSHRALGFERFQAILREKTLAVLANSILAATWKLCSTGKEPIDAIPTEARQLMKLGQLANPIVNFNIETLSSLVLTCPGGPCSIKSFRHPTSKCLDSSDSPRLPYPNAYVGYQAGTFPRHVYHPHGAIEMSGICVMTASEYRNHQATLAFQLAVHSAFMSNLAIVGMSLDDDYLLRACQ